MTIYRLSWENNFQDVKINDISKRLNFEMCHVEEKHFATEFDAGKYVGSILNQDILFTDKTEAYAAMVAENAKIYKTLLTELRGEE